MRPGLFWLSSAEFRTAARPSSDPYRSGAQVPVFLQTASRGALSSQRLPGTHCLPRGPLPIVAVCFFKASRKIFGKKFPPNFQDLMKKTLIYTSENINFLPTILREFADSVIHSIQSYLRKHFKLIELLIYY